MSRSLIPSVLLTALACAPLYGHAQALPPLSGAEKIDEHRTDLDALTLIRGPLDDADRGRSGAGWLHVEGSSVLSYYRLPAEVAPLRVLRDYQRALESAGFDVLFSCETRDGSCYQTRPGWSPITAPYEFALRFDDQPELPRLDSDFVRNYFGTQARYLLAARMEPEARTQRYVSLALAEHGRGNHAILREVEVELTERNAPPQATEISLLAQLQRDGRGLLPGLRFQPGHARLQVGSEGALAPLIAALHTDPRLRVAIVAQADRDTPAAQSEQLGLQRAQTLVATLTTGEGVAASRLQARAGTGPSTTGADTRVELIVLEPSEPTR